MIGVNSTVAKYCEELKKAEAVPRSEVGNQAAVMRALAGKTGASESPTRSRRLKRTATAVNPVKKPTVPCSSVKADHRKIAAA